MASQKRAEQWRTFMLARFFPQLWRDTKPRLSALLIGLLIAVLVLLAQIHFGVITNGVHPRLLSILWPYGLLALSFVLYHLARAPWLISNEHLDTVEALKRTISKREATIDALNETVGKKDGELHALQHPKRSPAEQHDFDKAKRALALLKEPGVIALRFLRSQEHLIFSFGGYVSAPLPAGLIYENALSVYRDCAEKGIVSSKKNSGNTEETFTIPPGMEKVLNELLFSDAADQA